jgi:hypothetical protein
MFVLQGNFCGIIGLSHVEVDDYARIDNVLVNVEPNNRTGLRVVGYLAPHSLERYQS